MLGMTTKSTNGRIAIAMVIVFIIWVLIGFVMSAASGSPMPVIETAIGGLLSALWMGLWFWIYTKIFCVCDDNNIVEAKAF